MPVEKFNVEKLSVEKFNTKYNDSKKPKIEIKREKKKEELSKNEQKQFLTSSQKEVIFKIVNRSVLGSKFKNVEEFDTKKDQLGKFI